MQCKWCRGNYNIQKYALLFKSIFFFIFQIAIFTYLELFILFYSILFFHSILTMWLNRCFSLSLQQFYFKSRAFDFFFFRKNCLWNFSFVSEKTNGCEFRYLRNGLSWPLSLCLFYYVDVKYISFRLAKVGW